MSNATPPKPADAANTPCMVTRDALPLYCPNPSMTLWSMHPRVFLPIDKTGREVCPYCGTVYVLQS
ncbi:Zinc-finger domain protein [Legionella geestiana]|uniref:Zinc-finger domain protein n=1 Tax=Legionella geestiana TaxID=45065 RepID=A0A0W0TLY2_9GAMM|nr:Zinc-finger domain protein [Legionella geestiana]QBS12562.1 zinc-finger domain-containing protein [Legionella geestiana]QDQ39722.1 zinc-finger domain-containing protein [Legionella geestiana]STX54989.1 Uncharacterized protein conserved in bacteria [Legionella geestiana]